MKQKRKGIGSKILKSVIEESKRKNKTLELHVEMNNPARKLYERLGFKELEKGQTHIFMERLV